jgi:hypothetical protein
MDGFVLNQAFLGYKKKLFCGGEELSDEIISLEFIDFNGSDARRDLDNLSNSMTRSDPQWKRYETRPTVAMEAMRDHFSRTLFPYPIL